MAIEKRKQYSSYDEYKSHQSEKTTRIVKEKSRREYLSRKKKLSDRLKTLVDGNFISKGQKVLCLGARTGEEVEVFREFGTDAIGVDLVPCPPLVVEGDFHNLPFESKSFDVLYTNCFDHVFDVDKFIESMMKVLKDGGIIVLDVYLKDALFKSLEVMYVDSSEDIENKFCKDFKFTLLHKDENAPKLYRKKHICIQYIFRK